MRKIEGFTLIEALVVICLIAIISAIAAPNILSWRSNAKLRGAAGNLKGDLELAKLKAIQENEPIAITFADQNYMVFVDNGDTEGKWVTGEVLLKTGNLPAGVYFDLSNDDFTFVNNWTRFNGNSTAKNGTAVLVNSKKDRRYVVVSSVGRIRVSKTAP